MRIDYAAKCRELAELAACSMATGPAGTDPSTLIGEALRLRAAADAALASAVAYAKAAGSTWDKVAAQFEVSTPTAWKAWKPATDEAARRIGDPAVRQSLVEQLPDLDQFARAHAGPAAAQPAGGPVSAGLPTRSLHDQLRELIALLRQPQTAGDAYTDQLRHAVVRRTRANDGEHAARQLAADLDQIAATSVA